MKEWDPVNCFMRNFLSLFTLMLEVSTFCPSAGSGNIKNFYLFLSFLSFFIFIYLYLSLFIFIYLFLSFFIFFYLFLSFFIFFYLFLRFNIRKG